MFLEEVKSSYPTRRTSFRSEKSKFERLKSMFQKKERSDGLELSREFDGVSG